MEHQEGQPVMIQYYDDNSKIKTITAIGTRNGVKKRLLQYSITSDEFIINDAIYISKYERRCDGLFYI